MKPCQVIYCTKGCTAIKYLKVKIKVSNAVDFEYA